MADLLFELGCEELPPGPLRAMADELGQRLVDGLDALDIARGEARTFATPRRLTVLINDVAERQPDRTVEKRGPSTKAPDKAVDGFARSCGVTRDDLTVVETDKGPYYTYSGEQAGQPLAELFGDLATEAVRKLTTPKRMRWGDSDEAFLRPVQWMVALHGETVLPVAMFGLAAGRETHGHRFHAPFPLELASPADYEMMLFDAQVIAHFSERRKIVAQQVTRAAERAGATAQLDADLLDEVTALVEWPVAITGKIDARFMTMPAEVLITTIESHQRYFPLRDASGTLLPAFATVANVESTDMAQVVAGNERVVRPRLEDALFFWNKDRKQSLSDYAPRLASVTYQKGLGSYADKSARLAKLADTLAPACGADAGHASRAATLAKADLVTNMVFEFTELEGIMGGHYARESGEPDAVADAIAEHYRPRGRSDAIPTTPEGHALALADKLDTLAGQFALGNKPTGDRDPLGLRRAALGVLRIVLEAELTLGLRSAIAAALAAQPVDTPADSAADDLLAFLLERLRGLLAEDGITPEVFESVAALGLDDALDIRARARAVAGFRETTASEHLAAAHKRVRNILKKSDDDAADPDPALFESEAETGLHTTTAELADTVRSRVTAGDYAGALDALATLQAPVDAFFDAVMVMADEPGVRANRLRLLTRLDGLLRQVADFSHLPG